MLYARKRVEPVEAKDVTKDDGLFFCPGCTTQVILKKGTIKAHHFAHLADRGCRYGQREGQLHRRLKEEIYQALSSCSQVSDLQQVCRELQQAYADVSCWWGSTPVAIEI